MKLNINDMSLMEKESLMLALPSHETSKFNKREWKTFMAHSSKIYRQYGITIQTFESVNLSNNNKIIYFKSSNYIPYFRQHKYQVSVEKGMHFIDFLRNMKPSSYVVISVKDDGSQQLTNEIVNELTDFGINLNSQHLQYSYIFVAHKMGPASFEVIHEKFALEDIEWEGVLGGREAVIRSGGALGSNSSSISLDEEEWSLNQRGINLVTIDPSSVKEIETINFDTFTTLFAQGSLFKATPPIVNDTPIHSSAEGQVGWELHGVIYADCTGAMENSYSKRGHIAFEVELELNSDDELVARHDWDFYLYMVLGQNPPKGIEKDKPLSYEQFRILKILGRFSPISMVDLFQFLADHPDVFLVTDTKHTELDIVRKQFSKLVEAAASFNYSVLMRVIPQLYSAEMYPVIEDIFPFTKYVYALYQTTDSDEQVLDFVKKNKIQNVTTYPERYSCTFGAELKKYGARLFILTLNETATARKYIRMN
ncbi:interleukin-like EMT inducer domain-containing protein [Paenibacillus qinlingensis]|uniref:interleukin-like EMT inducer domain-containing protein n=1 Tax=Paenibacillus qinlingensis TaxID=1837343 RepID=UPI001565FB60|nr:interleukin-like EMT inducer domain-containing protein [Paenibacillus qinlingensis]NQX59980.1 hypothetical protein [Paenibacillus qinlingensis]